MRFHIIYSLIVTSVLLDLTESGYPHRDFVKPESKRDRDADSDDDNPADEIDLASSHTQPDFENPAKKRVRRRAEEGAEDPAEDIGTSGVELHYHSRNLRRASTRACLELLMEDPYMYPRDFSDRMRAMFPSISSRKITEFRTNILRRTMIPHFAHQVILAHADRMPGAFRDVVDATMGAFARAKQYPTRDSMQRLVADWYRFVVAPALAGGEELPFTIESNRGGPPRAQMTRKTIREFLSVLLAERIGIPETTVQPPMTTVAAPLSPVIEESQDLLAGEDTRSGPTTHYSPVETDRDIDYLSELLRFAFGDNGESFIPNESVDLLEVPEVASDASAALDPLLPEGQ